MTQPQRTLFLNGTIAEESWFDDDVTPQLFRDELFSGDGDVVVWINSPGGDCVAAAQIYNMLMDYPGNVTVKIDGIAASAASVIAMAGTSVLMSPVSMLMIHNPMTLAMGDKAEMQKAIEMLDSVKESIINNWKKVNEKLFILNRNHGMNDGTVYARTRNGSLRYEITATGVSIEADLDSEDERHKNLHRDVCKGRVDKMSFSFIARECSYDRETHTRTILKIKKLYDVSAVDFPAYNDTSLTVTRDFFSAEHAKEFKALEQAARRRRLALALQINEIIHNKGV